MPSSFSQKTVHSSEKVGAGGSPARSAGTRRDGPWTRSSFIVSAIEDKLKKMARSAGRRKSPLPPTYRRNASTF